MRSKRVDPHSVQELPFHIFFEWPLVFTNVANIFAAASG